MSATHFDLLYARVPLVHLLHSDKQEVVELLHAGFQHRLQPEDLPGPRHYFAANNFSFALQRTNKTSRHIQSLHDAHVLDVEKKHNTWIRWLSPL